LPFKLKLPAAALCGRYFIGGMTAFWLLLLVFLLLPDEPIWLLQTVIVVWLLSFGLTLGSYLLLLLHRLGIFSDS
jgi:hypothetical protein